MWSEVFWRALAERAISTAAQGALLALGAEAVTAGGVDAMSVNWLSVLGFAVGGAFLAVVKGLAVGAATGDGPGLGGAETVRDDTGTEAPVDEDATSYIDADEAFTAFMASRE